MASRVILPLVVCVLLALVGCDVDSGRKDTSSLDAPGDASSSARAAGLRLAGELAPPKGSAWFGASIDWSRDSLAAYTSRLGHAPAVAVVFYRFPMAKQERTWLDQAVTQARKSDTMLLVTLEPRA